VSYLCRSWRHYGAGYLRAVNSARHSPTFIISVVLRYVSIARQRLRISSDFIIVLPLSLYCSLLNSFDWSQLAISCCWWSCLKDSHRSHGTMRTRFRQTKKLVIYCYCCTRILFPKDDLLVSGTVALNPLIALIQF